MVIVLTWLYDLLGFKMHGIDDVVPRHGLDDWLRRAAKLLSVSGIYRWSR